MIAAFLEALNKPLAIDKLNLPDLEAGQVLVQVHCSGICGAQVGEISGAKGEDKHLPHLLGHEGGGIVMDVGPGVSYVKEGDHVVLHWRKGRGIESKLPKYHLVNDVFVGGGSVTTFNDYAIISENRLTSIDVDIPFEVASLMGCAVTTGLGIINKEAELQIGQSIVVVGCGGVGLCVIQGADMVSAYPIIAVDLNDYKLDLARKFGATHTINVKNTGIYGLNGEIKKITGEINVCVDCTGSTSIISICYSMLSPKGKLILTGQPEWFKELRIPRMRDNYCGKLIMDSTGGHTDPSIDIPKYLKLYKSGKLKIEELITHRFPLERINEAIEVVKTRTCGRCILEMEHGNKKAQ